MVDSKVLFNCIENCEGFQCCPISPLGFAVLLLSIITILGLTFLIGYLFLREGVKDDKVKTSID